jgi:hypothetical protein
MEFTFIWTFDDPKFVHEDVDFEMEPSTDTYTVSGKVTDSRGDPLNGVEITFELNWDDYSVFTGPDGKYLIDNAPDLIYPGYVIEILDVELFGYALVNGEIPMVIVIWDDVTMDFVMSDRTMHNVTVIGTGLEARPDPSDVIDATRDFETALTPLSGYHLPSLLILVEMDRGIIDSILDEGTDYAYDPVTGIVTIFGPVCGDIRIYADGEQFTITLNASDLLQAPTKTFRGQNSLFVTFTPDPSVLIFVFPIDFLVTMDGTLLTEGTDYEYDPVAGMGAMTIYGPVDGDIVITAVYAITVNGTGLDLDASCDDTVEYGTPNLSLHLSETSGYPSFVRVIMNNVELADGTGYTYNSAAGDVVFIIPVDGHIIIDAVYTVTVNGTGLSVTPTTVTFDEVAVLTLAGTAPSDIKVTMNELPVSASDYTFSGGVITFNAGTTVTGDIVIDAVYTVTVNGTGLGLAAGSETAVFGDPMTKYYLTQTNGFPYDVFVTMNGTTVTDFDFDSGTGILTIGPNVDGDIVIDAVYKVTVYGTGLELHTGSETAVFDGTPTISLDVYTVITPGFPHDVIVDMNGDTLGSGSDYIYDVYAGEITMYKPVDGDIVITAV